jgi:hypothetical protein
MTAKHAMKAGAILGAVVGLSTVNRGASRHHLGFGAMSPVRSTPSAPVTMSLLVHQQAAGRITIIRHIVSWAADRVHIAMPDGREWLLERNRTDPGRVSGFLVYHGLRTIVFYEEGDLCTWFGVRGWSDVASFDRDSATPRRLLAVGPNARTRVALIPHAVDPDVLRPPPARFPGYRVIDLAEWLER